MDSPKTQRDHEICREAYKLDPRSTEATMADGLIPGTFYHVLSVTLPSGNLT